MIIDPETINKIKERVNLVDLVKEYTELSKVSKGLWSGHCPHPSHKDSSPSFKIYEDKKAWYCMGCHVGKKSTNHHNYGTDCIAFIQWIENKSFIDAITFLSKKYDIELKKDKYHKLYEKNLILARSYNHNLNDKVIDYLISRGLSKNDISDWMIGFDGERITFPLLDRYNRVVGFSNRIFYNRPDEAKYINSKNSEIFSKRLYLYGLNLIDRDFDEVRITEGTLDTILASKYKANNIVSTLGTAFTEEHLDLLIKLKKTPVFCFDGDEAGLKALNKAMAICSSKCVHSKVLLLKDGKDIADLSIELQYETENYISENSISHNQMVLNSILNKYDSKMNEVKLKLLPELNELVSSIKNENELFIIKNEINNRINIKF